VPQALALISGSLDSEVAATVVKQAGWEMTCTVFACPFQHRAHVERVAEHLGSPVATLSPDPNFLDIVRRPRFNFGGGPLSCLECRLRMLVAANQKRKEIGADLIVTGEVLGQRAANQSRRQIDLITYHSGAKDVLLRPLSAKLFDAPEAPKLSRLEIPAYDFSGSGRRPIRELARQLGIPEIDRPGPQCRLHEPQYLTRMDDLLVNQAEVDLADIELLQLGRHYRLARSAKAIVGRNAEDNEAIASWQARNRRGILFMPANFQGASVLLLGPIPKGDEIAMSLSAIRKPETPNEGFQFHVGDGLATLRDVVPVDPFKPIQA
jgi:tRNA-specific 2-thiouridylase